MTVALSETLVVVLRGQVLISSEGAAVLRRKAQSLHLSLFRPISRPPMLPFFYSQRIPRADLKRSLALSAEALCQRSRLLDLQTIPL